MIGELVRAARAQVVALFALSVTSNVLMLTGSVFMLQVYDRVLPSRSIPTLVVLTGLVVVLYGFYATIEWIRARMAGRFAGAIHEQFADALFPATIRLKLSGQRGPRANPMHDLDVVRMFVAGPGAISLLDLPWVPIYILLAFMLHPLLGAFALGGGLFILCLLAVNELHSRGPALATTVAASQRAAYASDAEMNAESIVAMGMLEAVTRRWSRAAELLLVTQQNSLDRTSFYSSLTKGVRYVLQSAVLAVGAYLVIKGEASGGLMIAASILTSRALAPIEQVVSHWRSFVNARQASKRVTQVLGASEAPERPTQLPLPTRRLSVEGLSTGGDEASGPVVFDVSFQLEAGDGLGIIGLSGSGKSSIARALVGVWPVLGGAVRLDGSELSHFAPTDLGRSIGYLPQSVELLAGTIAENIGRFDPEHPTEAILKAAKAARVHEFITSLSDGYETRIGSSGVGLSSGQRQRIGLARALYGEPFLIVLDEPNSNLDMEGDRALTEAILEARKRGAIVVTVAHRPSAIAATNKLLFLRDGRQVSFGDKQTVLQEIALVRPIDEKAA